MTTPAPMSPTVLNTVAGLVHAWHRHRETETRFYAQLREVVTAVEASLDIEGPPPGGCNTLTDNLADLLGLEPADIEKMLEDLE